jgi:succinoglycan biosynthesis transport protein ExoP
MSNAENQTSPENLPNGRMTSIRTSIPGAREAGNGRWPDGLELAAPAQPASQNVAVFLHALRRHWVPALAVGLVLGAGLAIAVWFGYGARYRAVALLTVSQIEDRVIENPVGANMPREFDIYKDTQQQIIKSRVVTQPALRDPNIAALAAVQRQRQRGRDPEAWLAEAIQVSFPGDAQWMEVSFTDESAVEAAKLVNAVVNAYMTDVVDAEKQERTAELQKLDDIYQVKSAEVRQQLSDVAKLAADLGTGDEQALRLMQQLAVQELSDYRRQQMQVQYELRRKMGELEAQRALLSGVDELEIPLFEVDKMLQVDPMARQIVEQLSVQRQIAGIVGNTVRPEAQQEYAGRYQNELQMLEQMLNQRSAEIRDGVRSLKRSELEQNIRLAESQVSSLTQLEQKLTKDVEAKQEAARKLTKSSIDLEMRKSALEENQQMLAAIAEKRETKKVELSSAARVRQISEADPPQEQYGFAVRVALAMLAGLAGLCLPAVGIVAWDVQSRRVNSADDVSRQIGLPVIGSLPKVPARVIRRLGTASGRSRVWQLRLSESVGTIAAKLLREAELEQVRTVLVTSATSGEGKSTVATQLAMSLARSGRRTVLVDLDLRRPAFDGVFGLPSEPGISEVLRAENDVPQVVHETATENLSVVVAGRCDRKALTSLANGAVGSILRELRGEFDFVIVDSSPVLSVADTRFVSQHVDEVVLSVFQDVSQVPKVTAACETLESFGVRRLQAVVTLPWDKQRDRSMRYSASIS